MKALCLSLAIGIAVSATARPDLIDCGTRVSLNPPVGCPLVAALKNDPNGLRESLFAAAKSNGYDLRKIPFPKSRAQLGWMRDETDRARRELEGLDRNRQWGWSRLDLRIGFLKLFIDEIQAALADPEGPTFAEYNVIATRFPLAMDLMGKSHVSPLFVHNEPTLFDRSWSGRSLTQAALIPGHRAVLYTDFPMVQHYYRGDERELEEYAIIHLSQDSVDADIDGDLFLRLLARRLYLAGAAAGPRPAHVYDDMRPTLFHGHDLEHAEQAYLAYKKMLWLAQNDPDKRIRDWYAATIPKAEQYMDDVIAAKNAITDEDMKRSVRAMNWSAFHESSTPVNPLDAYQYARLNLDNQFAFSKDQVNPVNELEQLYEGKILRDDALRWHLDYWEKLLPPPPLRQQLIDSHTADLRSNRRLRTPRLQPPQ